MTILLRAALGGLAAVLAVLVFDQGMVWVLYANGLLAEPPYDLARSGPLHLPHLADLCVWAGLYGLAYGIALPWLPRLPGSLLGLGLGLLATAIGWFVAAPANGLPIASGWAPEPMLIAVLTNGFWGIGVGVIAPMLIPPRLIARFR